MRSENDLVTRLQLGINKEKAYSELLDLYQERLYWHIRKLVKTHENADDVLQNTFIRIFKNINSFNRESALHTWMYRIAYNESMRYLGKEKKKSSLSLSDTNISPSKELKQDVYFDGDVAAAKLCDAIEGLTEKQKQVFQMKYFDELSFKNISEILNIKESTLKTSYYTAEKIIKEKIVKVTL